jgi:hypothetical protein
MSGRAIGQTQHVWYCCCDPVTQVTQTMCLRGRAGHVLLEKAGGLAAWLQINVRFILMGLASCQGGSVLPGMTACKTLQSTNTHKTHHFCQSFSKRFRTMDKALQYVAQIQGNFPVAHPSVSVTVCDRQVGVCTSGARCAELCRHMDCMRTHACSLAVILQE